MNYPSTAQHHLALAFALVVMLSACTQTEQTAPAEAPTAPFQFEAEQVWSYEIPEASEVLSSPRSADLNGDGILDIVIGGGLRNTYSPKAAKALNGATGQPLWEYTYRDQLFGSPRFQDVDGDGLPDVYLTGRAAGLICLKGNTGEPLWTFYKKSRSYDPNAEGWYNFFSPQLIADLDDDGLQDILVTNGGNHRIPDTDTTLRPAGKLVIVSGGTGDLIAQDTMPDGRECYYSPLIADVNGDGEQEIFFGTGGEVTRGGLFRTTLSALLNDDLESAIQLAGGRVYGFVGPGSLADFDGDGVLDIVNWSVDGSLYAFSGATSDTLWHHHMDDASSYNAPTIGQFTGSDAPDVFTNIFVGLYPNIRGYRQFLIDGETGQIVMDDTLNYGMNPASAMAVDLNGDGIHEAINLTLQFQPPSYAKATSRITLYDFANDTTYHSSLPIPGAITPSSPHLVDLNANGQLDLLFTYSADSIPGSNQRNTITRVSLTPTTTAKPSWGGYLSGDGSGVFR